MGKTNMLRTTASIALLLVFLISLSGCSGLMSTESAGEPEPGTRPSTPGNNPVAATVMPVPSEMVDSLPGDCYGTERHPIGESIADQFEIPYTQVMEWFCGGVEFEDILLALQTQKTTGIEVEVFLNLRKDGLGWDEIWQEMGISP
jgi:hypothetical protein